MLCYIGLVFLRHIYGYGYSFYSSSCSSGVGAFAASSDASLEEVVDSEVDSGAVEVVEVVATCFGGLGIGFRSSRWT